MFQCVRVHSKQHLLCDGGKGQLHIDPCLCTGLHEWNAILLKDKRNRGSSASVGNDTSTPSCDTSPSPASLHPPSSPPALRPCLTGRQRPQEGNESERWSGKVKHASCYLLQTHILLQLSHSLPHIHLLLLLPWDLCLFEGNRSFHRDAPHTTATISTIFHDYRKRTHSAPRCHLRAAGIKRTTLNCTSVSFISFKSH